MKFIYFGNVGSSKTSPLMKLILLPILLFVFIIGILLALSVGAVAMVARAFGFKLPFSAQSIKMPNFNKTEEASNENLQGYSTIWLESFNLIIEQEWFRTVQNIDVYHLKGTPYLAALDERMFTNWHHETWNGVFLQEVEREHPNSTHLIFLHYASGRITSIKKHLPLAIPSIEAISDEAITIYIRHDQGTITHEIHQSDVQLLLS